MTPTLRQRVRRLSLVRWYRRRTNGHAYWTGRNEGYEKGFEDGKRHWQIVRDVIATIKAEEQAERARLDADAPF